MARAVHLFAGGNSLLCPRRSIPFLLLAAVLIGLAALFWSSSQPAQAQSAVWDTDLTVRQLDGGEDHDNAPTTPRTLPTKFGCHYLHAEPLNRCSTGSLTDDEFNFGGTIYIVNDIELQPDTEGGRPLIRFDRPMEAALKRATLRVGSLTLEMSEARLADYTATWDNTGLDWYLAEHVRFTLTPGGPPPGTPGRPAMDPAAVWSATLTAWDLASGEHGCNTSDSVDKSKCSTALTDNEFTVGRNTYTVVRLEADRTNSKFYFGLQSTDSNLSGLSNYRLRFQVAPPSRTLDLAAATITGGWLDGTIPSLSGGERPGSEWNCYPRTPPQVRTGSHGVPP